MLSYFLFWIGRYFCLRYLAMLSQEEPTKKAGVAGQARWLKAGLWEDCLRCHIAMYEHVSHVSVLFAFTMG